ncbi:hypothetical protein MKK69_01650 [Methylobacterium sp. J-026]|uniref:hypothetical protein n=1 Tax=Methylobacterium sp. J-026 TaxID=2836624 RepID=UPI001FBB53E4|nr:hypothetical protein [Methylobacterium sp. J-026]MCJ2132780.1 hypothetical protein [Methylobacterium sp. J-026]
MLALSERFDHVAVECDDYYANGHLTPWLENAEELCLGAAAAALIEAAIAIRHNTEAGRKAKQRMLAHLDRWVGSNSVPYSEDNTSLGGRLALSLE